ncbi:UNVERIFIED_CONTAM: hypothetical protein NCL1_23342 [Trichonephila clavipes]
MPSYFQSDLHDTFLIKIFCPENLNFKRKLQIQSTVIVFLNSQRFLPHCYREINYMTRKQKSSFGKTRSFVQASKLQKKWSRLFLM